MGILGPKFSRPAPGSPVVPYSLFLVLVSQRNFYSNQPKKGCPYFNMVTGLLSRPVGKLQLLWVYQNPSLNSSRLTPPPPPQAEYRSWGLGLGGFWDLGLLTGFRAEGLSSASADDVGVVRKYQDNSLGGTEHLNYLLRRPLENQMHSSL